MAATKPKRLVILDTHAILHRAYHALPDFSSSKGVPTGGLYGLLSMLVKIINDLKPDYIAAAVDLPGGTFRDAAYKEYKGTRAQTEDALVEQLKRAPSVLEAFGIPVYSSPGFEADDVIGTIVEKVKKQKGLEVIIASGDKDALQLIEGERVRVFTLGKGLNDTIMYDDAAVRQRYGFGPEAVPDLKGIAGDPSDNIKGVPGVGEGSALKLLVIHGSLKALYAAIKKQGIEAIAAQAGVQKRFVELLAKHKEEAEFSKLLATIRRDVPIDFTVPKDAWRDGIHAERALDMLAEYDFRALMPRVRQLLGATTSAEEEVMGEKSGEGAPRTFRTELPTEPSLPAGVSQEEVDQMAVAVWVLDSNITTPTLDDIYRMGKSHHFHEAKARLLAEIKERDLSFIYEQIELPLMPVLRAMERRGVRIDQGFLKHLSKDYHKELERLAKNIYEHAGMEFNINSPKQLGDVLFDRLSLASAKQKKTATGARSTRESELVKLRELHPIIDEILHYRELQKLLSTYIDTIPELVDTESRLHTTFIQTNTSTGRLASVNPNLQNIPIKSELGRAIRNAFVPDEGYMLVSFDYSQIELRIAAFLSQDEGLSEIFKKGRDVHREVAARVFGVKDTEVTYEQRRRAKVINFGILYGMGVTSLQQALGTTRKEAQEFYDEYFAAFPRLAAYVEEVQADAARKGYAETFFGRRRYLDGIRSPIPYVRAAAERMAINAPIQGTQADLVKIAMIRVQELFDKEAKGKAYQLLQVHDELVFEIEKPLVAKLAPKIKHIMEECVAEKDRRGIPFIAEGKAGPTWGQMQEL